MNTYLMAVEETFGRPKWLGRETGHNHLCEVIRRVT